MNTNNPTLARSEARIQQEIVLYLQSVGIFVHSVPNEGAGKGRDGMMRTMQLVSMGLKKGVADLVVWWPRKEGDGAGYEVGYLEIKTPTGSQSQAQKAFELRCRKGGIRYDLARSVDDVKKLVEERTRGVAYESMYFPIKIC